jgi:hypothetical protein
MGFQSLLASAGTPRQAAAVDAPAQSSALFLIQSDSGDGASRRRKRMPSEVAARALDLLRGLQQGLLVGEGVDPRDLQDAAAEAEEMAGAADDPETRRLCAAVALRLRVERAKLGD